MSEHKPHAAVPPLPDIDATLEQWDAARKACAERARERGQEDLAVSFEHHGQDIGWAMRHELKRLVGVATLMTHPTTGEG